MAYDEKLREYMHHSRIPYSVSIGKDEQYVGDRYGNPVTREQIMGSNTRANQLLNGTPYVNYNLLVPNKYWQYGYTNVPQMQRLEQLGQQWQREKSLNDILRELFANEGVYD